MKQQLKKLIALLMALSCLLLAACGKEKPVDFTTAPLEQEESQMTQPSETGEVDNLMPWEKEGAKHPAEYTLEEYEALTDEQRKAFRDWMGAAGYAEWLDMAEAEAEAKKEGYPWEATGAKQPKDYTWADYQALTEVQKKAFMEHLGPYGLEAWLKKVQDQNKVTNPWDVAGAKQPKDYTWAEYQTLTDKQQAAFVNYLGPAGFQNWLTKVQGQQVVYPWEIAGAKKPQAYTWGEYEALTANQKKAFRNYLGSDGFEAWLESVQEKENPWEEDDAKQPADYTWEEYEALTEKQKVAFQEHLGASSFEEWLEKVLQPEEYPWEEDGAKQPGDYTWKDYEKLTEDQQAAFQEYLGEEAMKTWLRTVTEIPWEKPKAKQPEDYTLKEYEDLEDPKQLAFRVWLGTEAFEEWLFKAQNQEENPWEKPGAKQPADYTWEEFSALTIAQQMAFQDYLGEAGFEAWLQKVQSQVSVNPWEVPGAKQPLDYTWKEYQALTAEQQMAFQKHLGAEGFEAWMNKVQSQTGKNPWETPGAKQPADYTWKEYQALTAAQQMAFQNYLGAEGFEAWLNKVQGQEQPAANPWEVPGAKQPEDYTMAEFEALTAAQQMAFQNYLGAEGFEAWLNKVQGQEQPAANPWEVPGAKQPADYTWAEFEALTAAQQMAFQNYLGADGFEAWLNKVQGQEQTETNPWEVPGAKQPQDYTYEEFEALTAAQQMAFQKYLGPEGFEAWLNRVRG